MAQVPRLLYDYANTRIPELILRMGENQAAAQREAGQRTASLISGLGNIASGAIQEHAERSALSKRDAAVADLWDRSGGNPDVRDLVKIYGPKEGVALASNLEQWNQAKAKKGNEAMAGLPAAVGLMSRIGEPLRAAFYQNEVRPMALNSGAFTEADLPADYSPEIFEAMKGLAPEVQKKLTEVSPGASLYDPEKGQAVYTAPVAEKPVEPPQPRVVGRSLVSPDGKVIYRDPDTPAAPKEDRLVQVMGPEGTPIWVREREAVGKPAAQAARAVTGEERKTLGFYNRAKEAADSIEALEDKMQKQGLFDQARLASGQPLLQTDEQQAYTQAQRAFTEARLRKESGAAIANSEYANDRRIYFQQPGDSEAVKEQKKAARAVVLNSLGYGAGKAYEEYYGQPLRTPKSAKKAEAAPNETPKKKVNPFR